MMDLPRLEVLIGWLYLGTHTCRALTYVPQMLVVIRCTDGARSVSLLTWASWVVANATAVLYGAYVLRDAFFTFVSLTNFTCTAIVVALVQAKRRMHARRNSRKSDDPIPWSPT